MKKKKQTHEKKIIEILRKALGKETENISDIALKIGLDIEPELIKQAKLFSINDIMLWIDRGVKQEKDIKRKQVKELIKKLDALIKININSKNKMKTVAYGFVRDCLLKEVFKDIKGINCYEPKRER